MNLHDIFVFDSVSYFFVIVVSTTLDTFSVQAYGNLHGFFCSRYVGSETHRNHKIMADGIKQQVKQKNFL